MRMRASLAVASMLAGILHCAESVAQQYPARPVRLVVPSSPGGASDIRGRLLAHKLSEALGQQVVVENRPGASSAIGADFVAKSAPDGYTVLISPAALAINPHMAAELFRLTAGIDFLVVSYKGSGPGTIALLSGEVSFMFSTPPSAIPFVKAGRLRALGVTTRARMPGLPDVPTVAEAGFADYEAVQWFGLLVPAGIKPQGASQ